jgi:hypothetical protein
MPRHAMRGRDQTAYGRVCAPQAQGALPSHPDAEITAIVKQYLYRRRRLTRADGCGTGLERMTGRAVARRGRPAPPYPRSK